MSDPHGPVADAQTEPAGAEVADVEAARVRARVRQGLFGGEPQPVRVAHFDILGRLGEGAMGVVYEAMDTELQRVVALKLLHPETALGPEAGTAALLEEARSMARVRHPNVLVVHEVGVHGTQVYVAMERATGTLRDWLKRERPPTPRVIQVLLAAGRGLAAVHRAGLVHRDFKLDNVLMDDDGTPRVSDFGLALRTEVREFAARAGTPAYMAPEQLRGETADARSDQFAFAVAACEALSGKRPFDGENLEALLDAILTRTSPDALGSDIPPQVAAVLHTALEPEPSARHASMDVLVTRLEDRAAGDRAPEGRAPGSHAFKDRRPYAAMGIGVAVVALVLGAVLATRQTPGDARLPSPSASTLRSAPTPSASASPSAPPRSASASSSEPSTAAPAPVRDVTRTCTSEFRASSEKPTHPVAHAFDGIPATAWTEAAAGDGAGQWIEAELQPGTFVEAVEVRGGWAMTTASGLDLWRHNSTFRRMRVSWDGGEAEVAFDHERDRGKSKRVQVGAMTRSVRITALEVDRGRFLDLCLDEVKLIGHCASP
ncbi:MAG: protein kinase [Polyangiaceae bacterium]